MQTTLQRTAFIISALASPFLVIPTSAMLTIAHYAPTKRSLALWASTFVLLSVMPPVAYIFYGVHTKKITDWHVQLREQRTIPFLVAIIGSFLLSIAFYLEGVPLPLLSLAIVLFINGIIFFLITHFWKISIHAAALAGSIVIASVLIDQRFALLFAVLPLVIWARMQRQRHTLLQGIGATIIVSGVTLLFFKILGY